MNLIVIKWIFLTVAFSCFLNFGGYSQLQPKREMRGVWIATVANIDWPSSPTLSSDEQKRELLNWLDLAKVYHLNTIVLQIRPSADALYKSLFEPWSRYLTGKQGKAPDPYYDPLEFASKECRKRGLDIHVWLNPYRAVTDTSTKNIDPGHITKIHPEWFLVYGRTRYFDPGLPQTRDFVSKVVSDIVRRYDIDAVHMDDYFYPYRIDKVMFPDTISFNKFPNGFEIKQRDDWRRNNVDLIIKQLHDSIKAIKPWVEFGISPFGVWRNYEKDSTGSKTKAGQTNYDDLYADILKWQKEKWIDYIVPQIYWEIGKIVADYSILANWWGRNTYGCNVYIGQAPYKIDKKAKVKSWRSPKEIIRQIKLNREIPAISGSLFFSAKFMRANPGNLKKYLLKGPYRSLALPPENPLTMRINPGEPIKANIGLENKTIRLTWEKGKNTKYFVIYKFRRGKPASINQAESIFLVTSENSARITMSSDTNPQRFFYMVTSVSPSNTESQPVFFEK